MARPLTPSEILAKAKADSIKSAKEAMEEARKNAGPAKSAKEIDGQWVHCKLRRGPGSGSWVYMSAAEFMAKTAAERQKYVIQRDGRPGNYYGLVSHPAASRVRPPKVHRTLE
jgi:hypothetical protein